MDKNDMPETNETRDPRRLPSVALSNGKTYFIDKRLYQPRNTENPHDCIDDYSKVLDIEDFEKVRRRERFFSEFIAVSCVNCKKSFSTAQNSRRYILPSTVRIAHREIEIPSMVD